jgi:transcriptional regulator with XRE-family HTH domain
MAERAGDWLKRRRIAAGYRKQESLARQLGISRGAIGNWESGRGGPSPATVPALAAAVNVTQAEVIEAFGIQMHGALETPAPPWAKELTDQLRAIAADAAATRGDVKRLALELSGLRAALEASASPPAPPGGAKGGSRRSAGST